MNRLLKYIAAKPPSAAMERLFSFKKDISRAKRNQVYDETFIMLMFMKNNVHVQLKLS